MKWFLIVVVAIIALMPVGMSADDDADPANVDVILPADLIGDGWTLASSEPANSRLTIWNVQSTYVDDSGNSVVIWAIDLGDNLDTVSTTWGTVRTFWGATAEREAVVGNPLTEGFGRTDIDLPSGVSDGLRIEGGNRTSQMTTGVGVFGSVTARVAIIVLTEGTVNGLTGVAATDYVAGLYFAALSA